jgi:TolA-binding protein
MTVLLVFKIASKGKRFTLIQRGSCMKYLFLSSVAFGIFVAGCARLSEDQLWQKAEETRAKGNYDSTIQVCQTLIRQYPDGKNASAALYMLGDVCQNAKHDYPAAVNYYHAFVTRYPDLNATPVAMFVIGFIYNNNLQMLDSARAAYNAFIAKFPKHELAASARFELDNLGKTPDEIIATKKDVAEKSKKPPKKK